MDLDKTAVLHCQHVWTALLAATLLDIILLWIAYRKLRPGWVKVFVFVAGVFLIASLPFVNLVLGCGLI